MKSVPSYVADARTFLTGSTTGKGLLAAVGLVLAGGWGRAATPCWASTMLGVLCSLLLLPPAAAFRVKGPQTYTLVSTPRHPPTPNLLPHAHPPGARGAGTFAVAAYRVYERSNSGAAKRRRTVDKNRQLVEELSKHLPDKRADLAPSVIRVSSGGRLRAQSLLGDPTSAACVPPVRSSGARAVASRAVRRGLTGGRASEWLPGGRGGGAAEADRELVACLAAGLANAPSACPCPPAETAQRHRIHRGGGVPQIPVVPAQGEAL